MFMKLRPSSASRTLERRAQGIAGDLTLLIPQAAFMLCAA